MGRLSGFRYREVVRRLRAFGFEFDRQAAGSHEIWFHPVPENADVSPMRTPIALNAAVVICAAIVIAVGVYPQVFGRLGELASGG